jgi:hypothetical protein
MDLAVADYLYDIFVSYEKDWLMNNWLKDSFLPFLQTWVRMTVPEACGRPALPIFFDRSQVEIDFPTDLKLQLAGIDPGADWNESLQKALQHSRCLVAVLNPPYFFSPWCTLEWQSFRKRAERSGKTVIIPVVYYDGSSFPLDAQSPQRIDLTQFALDGEALRKGKLYGEFQLTMKLLAQRIAAAVKDAPSFETWELADAPAPSPEPQIGLTRFANAR